MDRSAFVIFASEVRAQLDRVEAVHELVEARAAISGPAGTESLGYQLHKPVLCLRRALPNRCHGF